MALNQPRRPGPAAEYRFQAAAPLIGLQQPMESRLNHNPRKDKLTRQYPVYAPQSELLSLRFATDETADGKRNRMRWGGDIHVPKQRKVRRACESLQHFGR